MGGCIFIVVAPLTNNAVKASVSKNLVKIRPAVAEQSRQKRKKYRMRTIHNAHDTASGVV